MRPSKSILRAFSVVLIIIALSGEVISASLTGQRRPDNTIRSGRLRTTGHARDAIFGIQRAPELKFDTVFIPAREDVQLSGYDKPLRTNRETILVTNSTPRTVGGLSVTIKYMDMQGRQLHERTDTLRADVPPGETRMLRLATWDTQHSYYYHRGQQPRTANVTPYDIVARINFILHPVDKK